MYLIDFHQCDYYERMDTETIERAIDEELEKLSLNENDVDSENDTEPEEYFTVNNGEVCIKNLCPLYHVTHLVIKIMLIFSLRVISFKSFFILQS